MKAIVVQDNPDNSLLWTDQPDPELKEGEVLIRVKAAAVNRADLLQRAGKYPPPPGASSILGLDAVGEIAELGPGVSNRDVGDPVCALLPGGGYAELAAAHQSHLIPLPEGWSFEEGAALPEVYITAYLNLFFEGELKPEETVLIHGGASGVGTAAVQLATAVGATVCTTVGTDEKATLVSELRAAKVINYKSSDFAVELGEGSVDLILDMVGASYLQSNIKVLKPQGRLVCIGLLGGPKGELNMLPLLTKRLKVIGSVLRSRSVAEKGKIIESFLNRFGSELESRKIVPVIDSVVPIHEAELAHERMRSNGNSGKIVLVL